MEYKTQRITFEGALGEELAARLELPTEKPRAYALFAHCFACSKDVFAASRISRELARQRIATLRFDFTGLGNSDGDFANTNFSSNVEDLVAATRYLRQEHEAPSILIGHSLGGAAVLTAAQHVDECKAVATIGAPFDPEHVIHLFGDSLETIEDKGEATVEIAGQTFKVKQQFVDDLRDQKLADLVGQLKRALLVMHAPRDQYVGVENARLIYEAARHPKSFVSLDDADHLLSDRSDASYVANVLAAWVERYLPAREESEAEADEALQKGLVRVTETRTGKYVQAVDLGPNHRMLADEPKDVGGDDLGPNPYDLLLAALGTCTNMTLRMYAEHKGIGLDRVTSILEHNKIHADDCEHCETQSGKIDHISRRIRIEGDLTDKERKRMLEIADKCPVHRTLHSEIHVETSGEDV